MTKRTSTTYRARKQENGIAEDIGGRRQPGSGNQWHSKGDAKGSRFLVEAKYTDKKRYTLSLDMIRSLQRQAVYERRNDWCIQLDLSGERVVIMPYHVLVELEDSAELT